MSPNKTPSRKMSSRKRLRKVATPSSSASGSSSRSTTPPVPNTTPVPSRTPVTRAHAESSEQRDVSCRRVIQFTPPPFDDKALPRFTAGADQHFDDVVDLSALPADLQARITVRAPFVQGLKVAVYDKEFYHQVAGLCAKGPHPHEVTEKMMPRAKWALKWGADVSGDTAPRISLKDADTESTREQYESLYCRVYGNKPDNGVLANFFLRAATYYFDEGKVVDWAALALEVHKKRFENRLLNPMKLMPPCLTKQVQGMVDEFVLTLSGFPKIKNLDASYLDAFKLQVQHAEEDESACVDQVCVSHFKLNWQHVQILFGSHFHSFIHNHCIHMVN